MAGADVIAPAAGGADPAPSDNPADRLFQDGTPLWAAQQRKTARALELYGNRFPTPVLAHQFFRYIITPRHGRWAFKPSGKTGTTSTLFFLFHLEFGFPLTATFDKAEGMNPDQAGHELANARVFAFLTEREDVTDCLATLAGTLRLATCRHPARRAVSGFQYLCRSHFLNSSQFAADRLRLNALVGFDWARHPNTPEGFVRFLEFIRIELDRNTTRQTNDHWAPQHLNIRPDILRPDLIGKVEDLPSFFSAIAHRLDRPIPPDFDAGIVRNRQPKVDLASFLDHPAAAALIAEIFARDFEVFGYDL